MCSLSALKNGWQIISPKKSFAVFAATPTEKAEWMAHINKCIADLLAKSESHGHSLADTLTHSLTHMLTHSLTCSHIHSLTHSHAHTFTHSLTHSHTHSLTCSFTHTHTHTHSLTHMLTHSLTCSHIHSLTCSHITHTLILCVGNTYRACSSVGARQ